MTKNTTNFKSWLNNFLSNRGIKAWRPIKIDGKRVPVAIVTDILSFAPESSQKEVRQALLRAGMNGHFSLVNELRNVYKTQCKMNAYRYKQHLAKCGMFSV